MAAIKKLTENFIEVYGKIFLWLYVFNSLKYASICQELQEITLQNLVLRYRFYDIAFETDDYYLLF